MTMNLIMPSKRLFGALLAVIFTLSSFDRVTYTDVAPDKPNKIALIIAIAAYDEHKTGWEPLSSDKDVVLIKNALVRIGFSESNISVLEDEDATRKGILDAIKELEEKARPGDHVVVHYSGHGHQIYDDGNEEADRLDEAVVAYGAFAKNTMYDRAGLPLGSLHLRDEDFGEAIAALRLKVGETGHVLVIIDSCHSGTITRGSAKQRGGLEPLMPEKIAPVQKEDHARQKGGFGLFEEKASRGNAAMGKYVLISGAAANQPNFETQDDQGNSVGSLSYCVSKALADLGKENMSYRALFAKIQSEMAIKARNQQPQIEGDIDYKVFNGEYVKQEPYFQLKSGKDNAIKIDGGRLSGIFEGTTIYFERSGASQRSAAPVAKGTVKSVLDFEATVELDAGQTLPSANLKEYWAFPHELTFGNKNMRVSVSRIRDGKLRDALTEALKNVKLVEVADANPDLLIEAPQSRGAFALEVIDAQGESLDFRTQDGGLTKIITSGDQKEVVFNCVTLVRNYAQSAFLKDIDVEDPMHRIEVSFIPRVPGSTDTLDIKDFTKGGIIEFEEKQMVYMRLTNTGTKKTYYNVIGISPNGDVYTMYPIPDSNRDPKDIFLQPGQSMILDDYEVVMGPPYGNEVCKVIASDYPVNLGPIINLRQNVATKGARGNIVSFDEVIGSVFDETASRGPTVRHSGEAKTSTYELVYRIVPAK